MAQLVTADPRTLVPQLSLAGTGFQQGQQISQSMANRQALEAQQARQAQLSGLQQQAATGDQKALEQVAGLDPQAARQMQNLLATMSEEERAEDIRENDVLTRTSLDALSIKDAGERRLFLERKKNQFIEDGRDTSNIERALSLDDAGLEQAITMQAREGQSISDLAKQAFPDVQKTIDQQLRERQVSVSEAAEKRQAEKESAQAKADIRVDEAARKEVVKATIKRKQGFIDSGIDAADSTANLRQSIDLLETIETGGIDKAIIQAKQLFGVEGADEAELSANLGKNVLAQLKPIFGAAFTAKEGQELKAIEAGFGKSTEGNKRLLKRALRIADRAARRGIAAAEDQGNEFAANEIRSALEFKLAEDEPQEDQQPAQQFTEGQTARNPQTGEVLTFRGGKWQ